MHPCWRITTDPTATAARALWIAELSLLTAVAQCQDGAAHAVAVYAGSGATGAAPARRGRAARGGAAPRRADPAAARRDRRRAGHPAAGHAFAGIDQRAATPFRREPRRAGRPARAARDRRRRHPWGPPARDGVGVDPGARPRPAVRTVGRGAA